MIVAETDRLRLRNWQPADADPFDAHLNTPEVMRHLGGVQPRAEVEAGIARLAACADAHGFTFWAVERREDLAFLGFCGLKPVRPEQTPEAFRGAIEIGWRLRADAWGQGYAREAAGAALDLAFGRFGLPRVIAMTVPPNSASWGLMRRLGMQARPDLDFDMPVHGRHIIYELEEQAWTASR